MKRRPEALAGSQFDILIIGGGIQGAAIALEAAGRGFKTALIEQGDFGQATSSNSLKIIHGGLRYLQQADLKRIRQSIRARRKFMAFAPHLIVPQPFLIPVYGHGIKGKEVMALALFINDLFSWDRNHNLPEKNFLPRGRIISRNEWVKIFPDLDKQGITGGALWYDGLVQHTERLTLQFILSASERGALTVNYVRAKGLLIEKETIKGIKAEEIFSQTEFPIQAKMVVNAAGPWLTRMLSALRQIPPINLNWVKGINLVVHKPIFAEHGVGLQGDRKTKAGKGSRFFFFVPWHGQTMIGTAYNRYLGEPDQARIEEKEIAEFLDEINAFYPPGQLTMNDVSWAHFGLQPVSEGQDEKDAHPEPDRHSAIFDHESLVNLKGLVSIKSTKYTTAPVLAEKVLDLIEAKGNKPACASPRVQGLSPYHKDSLKEDLDELALKDQSAAKVLLADHFWQNYGPRSRELLGYARQDPEAFQPISQYPLLTTAEVYHGIREEMALKLSDIVFRRTSMAQARCPGEEDLQRVAEIMSRELGWDELRRQREIEAVIKAYAPLRKMK